ncbi:MAG: carbohydrate ABC transporter permease [Anaerolineae bacterium]|nr:carbohydrate ABC transporter permease [Anaerolineae bacterium]
MQTWNKMTIWDALNYLALVLMSVAMLYPMLYALSVSVSSVEAVARNAVMLFPVGFDPGVYPEVLRSSAIARAYRNSIVYAVMHTAFTLTVCLVGGYLFSERRFRFRGALSLILGLTLFFSAGLIPTYLTYSRYGMVNTPWAVTLPGAFSYWYIILVRTNIQAIPQELKDAARIDGASDFRVLLQVILPLSTAILATIGLFAAVGSWNDYFGPLIYLQKTELQPLPLILQRVLIKSNAQVFDFYKTALTMGYLTKARMATVIVTTGPIIMVYPFVQRYFVKGVLIGSVKG